MSHISKHPAPGMGDLLPGYFVVPQNPIDPADSPSSLGVWDDVGGGLPAALGIRRPKIYRPVRSGRIPHIGELMQAHFVVPQNPLIKSLSGCSGGCSCGGCSRGVSGLGDVGTAIGDAISSITSGGTGTYVAIGAGMLLLYMMTSSGNNRERRAAAAKAKADYMEARADIQRRYPTRGSKLFGL